MPKNQSPTTLTPTNVKQLTIGTYQNRNLCVGLADKLKVHAYGMMPKAIIDVRRPSEPEEIKAYRTKIYVPITQKSISKVIASLEKIRRSQDWSIQYDPESTPKVVTESESLENYCETNYPVFQSLTNWAFSELLRKYLLDANGIIAVIPEEMPESNAEYVKPIAQFYDSEQIVDYAEGEYVVLKSRDKSTYHTAAGRVINTNGEIYYVITTTQIARYEQINTKGDLQAVQIYDHNMGFLPAFKAGGIFHCRINNETVFESRLAGMIPSLDEAAREYSDLQAEIVQHIHSEKYAYTNSECPDCHGTGHTKDETGKHITCSRCNGTGSVLNVSPYGIHLIHAASVGEQQLPAPPIGYIQKSPEIARLQDERVRQHIYDALSAVNMEFLSDTPIAQSGVAKAFDRDELNNFVNAIAEDIVRIMDGIYALICEYRYMHIVPNQEQRRLMLPHINVPTKYDILNTSNLMAELTAARQANINPVVLRELEIDYAKKQFCTDPEVARMAESTFDLDPLFGVREEDKMTMLSNRGITELDYIISCNIQSFVRRAFNTDKLFYTKNYEQKMDIIRKYAEEIQKANEPKQQIAFPDFGGLDKLQGNQEEEDQENPAEEDELQEESEEERTEPRAEEEDTKSKKTNTTKQEDTNKK